jgi:phosphatidate phosphatase APP1
MSFVLMGDSGEKDPKIYTETAQRYPDRILATYIHQVNITAKRIAQIDTLAEAAAAGSDLILVEDSLAMARHAVARGWIQPSGSSDHCRSPGWGCARKPCGSPSPGAS